MFLDATATLVVGKPFMELYIIVGIFLLNFQHFVSTRDSYHPQFAVGQIPPAPRWAPCIHIIIGVTCGGCATETIPNTFS